MPGGCASSYAMKETLTDNAENTLADDLVHDWLHSALPVAHTVSIHPVLPPSVTFLYV